LLRAAILPLKRIYGIKMQVCGSEHLNIKEPYVIVCNHQASLDLMGMVEVIPDRCVPIAKKELMYMGTVGWACWLSGIIFIDRHKREDAIDVISQTARTMRRENLRVLIFPEGTRNQEKSMLPFKRGAFHLAVQAQVPIFPMVIAQYRDFFSSKDKKFTSGTCTIRILPKVETQGLTPKDVPKLTETVRQTMADTLIEMSSNHRGDQCAEQPPLLHGAGAGMGMGNPRHYVVLFPAVIYYPYVGKVHVHLMDLDEPVRVSLHLESSQEAPNMTVEQQGSGILQLNWPRFTNFSAFPKGMYELAKMHISIQGGSLQVYESRTVLVDAMELRTFVQADKDVYKPGETVKFRILRLDHNFIPSNTE
ncbi:PREDICTED: 1-acyl-sn-glycerol-3-phosphate acyltransferase alpha-like, partial [Apaloderma vittatum]|uniref:1-acyl-sn-glycerol-3-phosphate acyltransferase alpha-like n=1 Tax=Apaloderma vittatum TaxID=57397 RepID=UPI0005216193